MNETEKLSHDLKDIKQMMERSSRFISLSGLSGVSAGVCALTGAWFASSLLKSKGHSLSGMRGHTTGLNDLSNSTKALENQLLLIAVCTFIAAFLSAFIFTYRRSKKTGVPVWGTTAKRLLFNVSIPMITGGIFLYAMMQSGVYDFVASGCLIFYGLGVLNASKYTFQEARYLGLSEILLGLISLFFIGGGLYFWATGFGALHIIYGIAMWMKYERN